MTQAFLKSSAIKDMTVHTFVRWNKFEAIHFFATVRWGDPERPICPCCGAIARHKFRRHRGTWVCKACDSEFSVTTNTLLSSRKKSLADIALCIFMWVTQEKGKAAQEVARQVGYSVKGANVLWGKSREAVVRARQEPEKLHGLVQMDGAHFGGKPRKLAKKLKQDPVAVQLTIAGRREEADVLNRGRHRQFALNELKKGKRRIVMVARECSTERGKGAYRTIVKIAYAENATAAKALVSQHVDTDATIWTDENAAYSDLSATHEHEVVNHQVEYVTDAGVHENQAESFFSRARRAQYGVYHRFEPKYLADFMEEFAWREDARLCTNRQKLTAVLKMLLAEGHSKYFRGYYQGRKRLGELIMGQEVPIKSVKSARVPR